MQDLTKCLTVNYTLYETELEQLNVILLLYVYSKTNAVRFYLNNSESNNIPFVTKIKVFDFFL
jgi:hypothetical protein